MSMNPISLQKQPSGPADCPSCGCPETKVVRTRVRTIGSGDKSRTLRHRRRECTHCGSRFTTRVPDEPVLGGSITTPKSGRK